MPMFKNVVAAVALSTALTGGVVSLGAITATTGASASASFHSDWGCGHGCWRRWGCNRCHRHGRSNRNHNHNANSQQQQQRVENFVLITVAPTPTATPVP